MIRVEDAQERGKYRIGTVAQLTGLTADTIRMWERRYATVSPVRTEGGTRLYGDDEVTRLQLMRALTEAGDPIGAIAGLPTDALRERLAHLATLGDRSSRDHVDPAAPVRVAVLDTALPEQLRVSPTDLGRLEITATAADGEALEQQLAAGNGADVLVANLALLGVRPLEALERCRAAAGARLIVVLYDWATRKLLARLGAAGVKLVRGPVSVSALRRTLLDLWIIRAAEGQAEPVAPEPVRLLTPPGPRPTVPERRFSGEQLARLREISSSVDCECPNHLAAIIANLVSFEEYSRDCESRTPADAALHQLLHHGTANARAAMENLLVRVCEQDGIKV